MEKLNSISGKNPRLLVYPAIMAALTAIGAYIVIPLPISPVPVTLQNLFVILSGMLLGAKAGLISQIIYLALGILGLPVFAGGTAGIGVIFSPSGGYLLAFPLAAYICGKLAGISLLKLSVSALTGMMIIYLSGALFMMLFWEFNLLQALNAGVLPFIPGDIFKLMLAVAFRMSLPAEFRRKLEVTAS